jgi:signal transduction histidine kinase
VLSGKGSYQPPGFEDSVRASSVDGELSFLVRATPVYGFGKGIAGAAIILQDVSRLRRFDDLKNDLIATVAHEYRTPLTSLHMAIHLCLEGTVGPLTEKQADLLYAARSDCERLQTLVNDMLDLSRLQAGKVAIHGVPALPHRLVESSLAAHEPAARQGQVRIETEVTPSLEAVLADPDRIAVLFDNLINNALRHTPPGGNVILRALPESGAIRFEVHDSGPGIAAEHLDRIFERFYRVPGTTGGGAGLGLSIAKEIVQAHHGKIGVTSEPGQGSTFWFTLPVVGPAPGPTPAPTS